MILHYAIWDQIKVASHSNDQLVEYAEFLQDEVFINPIQVKDGSYVTPKSPGWGLEMHEDFLSAHIHIQMAMYGKIELLQEASLFYHDKEHCYIIKIIRLPQITKI
jgi:hypothetical protein